VFIKSIEEDVGFEPTGPFRPLVFKTSAIDHSANLPVWVINGNRTRDNLNHNQALYQLSYNHHMLRVWGSNPIDHPYER